MQLQYYHLPFLLPSLIILYCLLKPNQAHHLKPLNQVKQAQFNQTVQTNQTGHPGQTGQPSLPGPSVSSDHTGNNKSEQISQTIQTGHSGQNQSGHSVSAKGPLD